MLSSPLVTIRDATPEDADTIAALGASFHEEAGWSDVASFNEDDCREFLRALPAQKGAIYLVAEADGKIVGMAAGIIAPLYFNRSHRHAQELFFWVDPEHRGRVGGRLLDVFEEAARNWGTDTMALVALNQVRPELTGRLYSRRGYRASEHYWIRRL